MRLPQARRVIQLIAVFALLFGLLPQIARAQSADRPELPDVTAKAVYSFDIDAGVELYAKNENEQLEPASTTKLATALLFVRNVSDLTQTVTIEPQDLNAAGESTMALQTGDVVTYEDLLYGILLPSGNDAAKTAARIVGTQLLEAEGNEGDDPVERFVEEMNKLAAEFGMDQTHFLNPTGLHEPGHVTSARDLATLARKTLPQRAIRDVIDQASYVVNYQGPNAREATIVTTVALKNEGVAGVIGGKTGTTPEAGACLVLETQERGGNRVITVLLGSDIEFTADGFQAEGTDRRYDDARAILDKMDDDYEWVDISRAEDVPGLQEEMSVWQVALDNDDSIVVPRRDEGAVSYLLQLGPEAEPDAEVGRVLFFINAEQVAERPVVQLGPD